MSDLARERPCIHVCAVAGADPSLYGWVEIGAEEEGLPTRSVAVAEHDAVAAAYAAAQGSRFGVGVAIAPDRVVLHEVHMPPAQPVLSFDMASAPKRPCRAMGGNAARLVVHLPLWVALEPAPVPSPDQAGRVTTSVPPAVRREQATSNGEWGDVDVKRIATTVARLLIARGIQ
jgi:hypothetical protein